MGDLSVNRLLIDHGPTPHVKQATDPHVGSPLTDQFLTNHGPCLHDWSVPSMRSNYEEENKGVINALIPYSNPFKRDLPTRLFDDWLNNTLMTTIASWMRSVTNLLIFGKSGPG